MILWPLNLESKFALLNFLFGAVKLLTKNADPDHHSYSGHVLDLIYVDLFYCLMVVASVKM